MENENQKPKRSYRKVYIYSIIILVSIFFLFALVFPPLISTYVLRPALKDGFNKLTSNSYHLSYNKLKLNLLSRNLEMSNINIQAILDTHQHQTVQSFHLDLLSLKKLSYWSLFLGELELKSVVLDQLKINMELKTKVDSIQEHSAEMTQVNRYINSLLIKELKLNNSDICISYNGDSLLMIDSSNFVFKNIQLDSLNHPKKKIPTVDFFQADIPQMDMFSKKNNIQISKLSIDEKRLTTFGLDCEQIQIVNKENGNFQKFTEVKMILDSILRTDTGKRMHFSAKKFQIDCHSVTQKSYQLRNVKTDQLLKELEQSINKVGVDIGFELFGFSTDILELANPGFQTEISDLNIDFTNLSYDNGHLTNKNYTLSISNHSFQSNATGNSWSTKKLDYFSNDGNLSIDDLEFNSSNPKQVLPIYRSSAINASQFQLSELLSNHQIKMESLKIDTPQIYLENISQNQKKSSPFPLSIQINQFKINNGELDWQEKALILKQINLLTENINIPIDYSGKIEDFFDEIMGDVGSLTWDQSKKDYQLSLGNIQVDSRKGAISVADVDIAFHKKDWPTKILAKNIDLSGLNWLELMKKSKKVKLDSLQCAFIDIQGDYEDWIKGNSNKNVGLWEVECKYLLFPELTANIKVEQSGRPSQLLLEKLKINANQIAFNQAKAPYPSFKQLLVGAEYSSFSQMLDSLLITANNWSYNYETEDFISNEISIKINNEDKRQKTNAFIYFDLRKSKISGLNLFEVFIDKKLALDYIELENPIIDIKSKRFSKVEYKGQAQSFYQSVQSEVEKYQSIGFRKFHLKDLTLKLNNQYFERKDQVYIDDIDLDIEHFYVDYTEFNKLSKFLFSDRVEFSFGGYFQSINNGERLIYLKKGSVSSLDNRIYFNDLRVLSLGDSIKFPVNFMVKDIVFQDFKLLPTNRFPELYLGSAFFNDSEIKIKQLKSSNKDEVKPRLENINLFPLFSDQLSAINIDHFEFNNLDLDLPVGDFSFDLKDMTLLIDKIQIDSANNAFGANKFLYSDVVSLVIPDFSMRSLDRFYRYSFKKLSLNSGTKSIRLDSLQILSSYDRKTFSANLKNQKDQLDITIPVLEIENIDYQDAIFRNRYKAGKILLSDPTFFIFKDKTIAVDTTQYKAMPAELLRNLNFYVNLDTLEFDHAYLKYEELSSKIDQPGEIFFNQLKGRALGISNDADYVKFGGLLRINITGELMGESDMNINAVFPLNSVDDDFIFMASMQTLQASSLNPLVKPLTLLSAKEGQFNQMQMNVKGNNQQATGQMLLKYENLKVEVQKKDMNERQIVSFLANSLIRKNNNNLLVPRYGPIYFERLKYRSFIHYFSHFAIVGAKTSLGIEKRKIKRKIKDFEKAQSKK